MITIFYPVQGTSHVTPEKAPENLLRQDVMLNALNTVGLLPQYVEGEVTEEEISRFHPMEYVEILARMIKLKGIGAYTSLDCQGDTFGGDFSIVAAREYAAAALKGARGLISGEMRNVLCVGRPPGHHAHPFPTWDEDTGRFHSLGFCILNIAGVAISNIIAENPGTRVALLDLDAHHGDGSQAGFYDRNDVLFISAHGLWDGFYPETGRENERGSGVGKGYNYNFPYKQNRGKKPLTRIKEAIAHLKNMKEGQGNAIPFAADLLVVSLGFDTLEGDPCGQLPKGRGLKPKDFTDIAHLVAGVGIQKILTIVEGGYDRKQIGPAVTNYAQAMQAAVTSDQEGDGDMVMEDSA